MSLMAFYDSAGLSHSMLAKPLLLPLTPELYCVDFAKGSIYFRQKVIADVPCYPANVDLLDRFLGGWLLWRQKPSNRGGGEGGGNGL